ncbi:MAG: tRNA (adenosine(37)-N6)-threonylcarbamoyltransferase complex ATPase subunit type 1 TsaE [Clostridia bacterium]|nr:tRNA (adenosine(37)-N6)-threonylcarbamoyltransferase complex ATPase subunit type 1 TsaE [Clostridia bacterium]
MEKYVVKTLEETRVLAEQFADTIKVGDVVLLSGDLGAGKTTFTQFVFKYLGVQGVVNSPTFAVLKTYDANGIELNHFDAYRINSSEAIECGFDEVISAREGITFIEWSQNIAELLPTDCVKVDITLQGDERLFTIER